MKRRQAEKDLLRCRETLRTALDHLTGFAFVKLGDEQLDEITRQLSRSGEATINFDHFIEPGEIIPIEITIRNRRKATKAEIAENGAAR